MRAPSIFFGPVRSAAALLCLTHLLAACTAATGTSEPHGGSTASRSATEDGVPTPRMLVKPYYLAESSGAFRKDDVANALVAATEDLHLGGLGTLRHEESINIDLEESGLRYLKKVPVIAVIGYQSFEEGGLVVLDVVTAQAINKPDGEPAGQDRYRFVRTQDDTSLLTIAHYLLEGSSTCAKAVANQEELVPLPDGVTADECLAQSQVVVEANGRQRELEEVERNAFGGNMAQTILREALDDLGFADAADLAPALSTSAADLSVAYYERDDARLLIVAAGDAELYTFALRDGERFSLDHRTGEVLLDSSATAEELTPMAFFGATAPSPVSQDPTKPRGYTEAEWKNAFTPEEREAIKIMLDTRCGGVSTSPCSDSD